MDIDRADYVIVGCGTAGSALAARLTEDPGVSVDVIEAGPRYRGLPIHIPAALGALYEKGAFHWGYKSLPERFAGDRTFPYKMGRLVGGSSAINGLVWVRGNARDYDDWEASGCPGWSYESVAPIFRRIEAFEDRSDAQMGHDGPIPVIAGRPERQPLSGAFVKAAVQAGYEINPNYNGAEQDGFCALHRNVRLGRRGDVYQGYIHPARRRPNLRITSRHTVQKLVLEGKRVTGVQMVAAGKVRYALANKEVLVCAGAIASPQLLEVSGIGNPEVLSKAGIVPLHALPGVGENFHTHPTIALSYSCKYPISLLNDTRGIGKLSAGVRWMLSGTGPAATNHFEAGAFLRARPEADRPDFQLTFLPLALGGTTGALDIHGFQIYVELIGCRSRGHTHVVSDDIACQPEFRFNFLQHPRDIEVFRCAIRMVREIVAQPALASLTDSELEPGREVVSDEQLDNWIRERTSMSHHLAGSCKMGPPDDPLAVIDPQLQVHGLQGIRVVDASIMPTVVSGNTHAATIAIAEKAADIIQKGDRSQA